MKQNLIESTSGKASRRFAMALLCIGALAFSACADNEVRGADGKPGADGAPGADGEPGADGADLTAEPPAEYVAADGIKGGAAYSQWYHADGGGKGSLSADYGITISAEFHRCKTCHAWDGLGNAGSYADRTGLSTGTAGRPDVSPLNIRRSAATSSYEGLFDSIAAPYGRAKNSPNNGHPDFTALLTNDQIWNLVKFMKEEFIDPNELYTLTITGAPMHYEYPGGVTTLVKPTLVYTNIGTNGTAASGKTTWTNQCAGCHGPTGLNNKIDGTVSLGKFFRTKPHEAWFKVKFGQPGTGMNPGAFITSTADMKNLYKALANATDFPD